MKTNPLRLKAIALTLGCLLALPSAPIQAQSPAKPKNAEIAVGVVVVCVGGYCIYKIARFCSNHFPKKEAKATNAPPDDLLSPKALSPEVGKSYLLDGYCVDYSGAGGAGGAESSIVTTSLRISLNNGSLRTQIHAEVGFQDYASFQTEVAGHGLTLGTESYEINRTASNPVPLPSGSHRVRVSCSTDMLNWQTLLEATVDEGGAFGVQDATAAGSVFYRAERIDP